MDIETLPKLEQVELTDEVMEQRMGRFIPTDTDNGARITRRYGDTEYEVLPNRDPRLDEIENWEPGQMR